MAYAGEKKRLRFDEYDYERHSPYYPHMAPPGGPAPLTHPNLPPLSGLPSLSTPFDSPYPLAGNDFSSSRFASSGAPDTLQGSFGVQRAWPAAADEARDRALGLGPGPGAGGASMGPGLRGASDPPDAQYVMSFEAAGPSPALLLRGVHGCSERDVHAALVRFGPVFRVFMLSDWAALVEFSDIPSAQQLVRMSANQQVLVCGRPVVATYANLAQWNAMERERDAPLPFPPGSEGFPPGMGVGRGPGRAPGMGFHSGADREESEEERVQRAPNRVLLFRIAQCIYPITPEIMHTICSPYGKVLRVVLFKKLGVQQGLVEFEDLEGACRVKEALQGADIYSGCCTLQIEFSRSAGLRVERNLPDQCDFERELRFSADTRARPDKGPLLGPSPPHRMPPPAGHRFRPPSPGGAGFPRGGPPRLFPDERFTSDREPLPYPPHSFPPGAGDGRARMAGIRGQPGPGAHGGGDYVAGPGAENGAAPGRSPVLMVYGLHAPEGQTINCDHVFNLFCLYGDIVRIKMLQKTKGAAMVQMANGTAALCALEHLQHASLFGTKLSMHHSQAPAIYDPPGPPAQLDDGTPSIKDYNESRLNRFSTPEFASKNKLVAPTRTLHFFNCPPSFDERLIGEIFRQWGAPMPAKVVCFPQRGGGGGPGGAGRAHGPTKCSSGLAEWENEGLALEALCLVNHVSVNCARDSNRPFCVKLAFSTSPIHEERLPPGARNNPYARGEPGHGGEDARSVPNGTSEYRSSNANGVTLGSSGPIGGLGVGGQAGAQGDRPSRNQSLSAPEEGEVPGAHW